MSVNSGVRLDEASSFHLILHLLNASFTVPSGNTLIGACSEITTGLFLEIEAGAVFYVLP